MSAAGRDDTDAPEGASTSGTIPPEEWVPHMPNDWAEWAGMEPLYASDLPAEARPEFARSLAERDKPVAKAPRKRKRKRNRKPKPPEGES